MKLVALVGTNASYSYNRKLLWYMKKRFGQLAQIDVLEISDLPLFSEDTLDRPDSVLFLSNKIAEADGLIISTPEYDHSITAALKSVLEWLSWGMSIH
ncbi:NADPH-dependent FMN reductase [Lactococcus fujiensis]|uniref:NADPH-dependent FMN reductase n=1 Tax=Lactococcus fujiensis TaxID=610251 RepID=UPI000AC730EB